MKLLIKNAVLADGSQKDILCDNGSVVRIARSILSKSAEVIDAAGLTVMPGLVDMHCHLRDPGYEYKESIASGTRAAAMGGFTSVACMANTRPVNDNKTVTTYILHTAEKTGAVRVYPIGAATKGLCGEELSEMNALREAGAVAVSDDGRPVQSPAMMRRVLEYAAMVGLPVISHCEDLDMADGGLMNEGLNATMMGLRGIPAAAEEIMTARDLILAGHAGQPVHIAHVSTRLSVELIRQAKRRGVRVTCETCPHYFSLTDDACLGFFTNAKVNPPLREARDAEAIIEGLCDGTIDVIATDHAPHHEDEKNIEFAQAANGFSGFETAFALSFTHLVLPGHLTLAELQQKMCAAPAAILGLQAGSLKTGAPADLMLFDAAERWTVDPSAFVSKGKNTPFGGHELTGRVRYTIVGGRAVVSDGALTV